MQIYFYRAKSCILLYISGLTDSQINDSNIKKASKNSSDYTSKCVVLTRVLNYFLHAEAGIVPNLLLSFSKNEPRILIKLFL